MAYEPTLEHLTSMDFKIETGGTTILFRDYDNRATLETYPANSIIAVANGADIRIQFNGGERILVDKLDITNITINGVLVTQVQATAINELNELYANVGSGIAPTITSSTSLASIVGNNINFTPTGTNVVTWSYDSLPTGIVSVEGQHKTLIGGSGLSAGTYNIIARATNYHGTDTKTITLTVSPVYTNMYSFEGLATNSYFSTGASVADNNTCPMYMAQGTTTGTPWTLWTWFKLSSSAPGANSARSIFSFGFFDHGYGWGQRCMFVAAAKSSAGGVDLRLYYGNTRYGNYVRFIHHGAALDAWHSLMIVYDGGNVNDGTGNAFSMAIDGTFITPTVTINGTGSADGVWCSSGSANRNTLKIGHNPGRDSEYLLVSELATFAADKTADLTSLHNGGNANLDLTPYSPAQWYRMGDDGDYAATPLMVNRGSLPNLDMTMQSGTVANYVSDVP